MIGFIALVDQAAIGIYFLLAAGILFALRRVFVHGQELRSSYFELERDLARYRRQNALTAAILLLEVAIIVAGVQAVIVPELLRDQQIDALIAEAAADDDSFETPAPGQPAANLGIEPVPLPRSADLAAQIRATPLPTPTPVGTLIPADPPIGCDSPQAQLQVPGNGMRVFQPIPVVGTLYADQFSYATLEISGASTLGAFQVIADQALEVRERAEFSQFVPAGYEPGEYQFRLMVFDITNTLQAHCLVHIYISEPVPTNTPAR